MRGMESDLSRVEALVGEVTSLPTLPEVLGRLNRLLDDPDAKIGDVADAVLRDQALTANVLRLVNSSFFARHRQVVNLREAIVFLGFRTLRNLVTTTALMRCLPWRHKLLHPRRFWEHSLATAIVARQIAENLDYTDTESAYLGGLVHDLGLVLMSQFLPEAMAVIVRRIVEEHVSLEEAERDVLGVGHTAFGAWLGKHWAFPQELIDVMYYHEDPIESTPNAHLVALVSVADTFCLSAGLGCGLTGYWSRVIEEAPSWKILKGAFPVLARTDWARFRMDLESQSDEIRDLVETMFEPQNEEVLAW
ncbi:MAG: HDOD domain-containing protein [candidate division KSB1 bacterium]|nr:HDOD domain-containing protein [candidate division KSB1 bacterium]